TAPPCQYSTSAKSVMQSMPSDFHHSNTIFSSNGICCARNTAATANAGFAISYTTTSLGTGNIKVVLTFNIAAPASAGANTKWQVVWGTGVAPACNAGSTGTIVGNQYSMTSQSSANAGGSAQSAGFSLVGLTPATSYWFDVRP